ncbi:hypothetical protein K3725_01235 [Leisingera sp. S132]|uniref:hypothetical protein n=1 Tax=Leisingera sp. S132 TaxID=2867016 RepID=UPI0021A52539|nr:hypothetical protein [Leisingera sp. S132]UWQ79664.1 hypothetical protein K3725_01235 [Leisingera sp. S132]
MQLFDMFGEPPQFTVHEMMMVLRSGVFLKYAAAVVLLLVAFDTHGYREAGMPLQANILIWMVCVAAFVLVYAAVLLGWPARRWGCICTGASSQAVDSRPNCRPRRLCRSSRFSR